MKFIWKTVATILDHCLGKSINFCNVLHIFLDNCGNGTASPKIKLLQQLEPIKAEVLSKIFMDLQKWYDSMDKVKCQDTLEG